MVVVAVVVIGVMGKVVLPAAMMIMVVSWMGMGMIVVMVAVMLTMATVMTTATSSTTGHISAGSCVQVTIIRRGSWSCDSSPWL